MITIDDKPSDVLIEELEQMLDRAAKRTKKHIIQ